MPNFIGLDLGTTTVTGLLLDAGRGEVLRLAQRRNDAAITPARPTRAEQDPHRVRALALEVLAELATGHQVAGIALTGQMHGLLCVDAAGQPLTPLISWQDQRTSEPLPGGRTALDQLHTRLAGLDWRENGCPIQHGYGAATLYWLMLHDALPAATHRACTIADWLAGQLAGEVPVTDPTFAASWGVYNLLAGAWNGGLFERLGLDASLFPTVRPSGEQLGGLAPHLAREIGLRPGLPIFNPLGDTQASFLGASLPPAGQGGHTSPPPAGGTEGGQTAASTIFFNLGTGGQICWIVPDYERPTAAVETRPLLPGRYLRVGASLCGGAAYAWLNRTVRDWLAEFGTALEEDAVYERLNALAAACDDTRSLRVRTTFLGVRGDPAAPAGATVQSGAIEGIGLEGMHLGSLARATLAGIVDELYDLYRTHAGAGSGRAQIVASGGGVRKNPPLPGLIEARFGLPVHVPPQRETAALGAASTARFG
jgi:sedoheptulokinase